MNHKVFKTYGKKLIKICFGWTNKFSLKSKLLFSFVFIGVLAVLLCGLYFYHLSYDSILENATRYNMEMLQQVDKNIQSKIKAIDNTLLSIVINKPLVSKLNESQGVALGRNKREINEYIRSIVISTNDISSLVIVDKNGEMYGSEDGYLPENYEFKKSEYYLKTIENKGTNIWFGRRRSILVYGYKKQPLMVFPSAFTIREFYTHNDYVGTAIMSLKESAFADSIKNIYENKPGNIIMLDDKMQIMLSAKPLNGGVTPDIFKDIKGETGNYNIKLQGEDNLVTYYRNERTGWYTVSTIPVTFLINDTIKIKNAILRISFLVIILCMLLSFAITMGITQGFKKLKGVMMKIRKGDFSVRVNSKRKDEIGQLCNTFDTMIEYINDLIKKGYEQKIREKSAQLKALQAQIAPHFLYNALDSINWMLIDKNEHEISNIIVALGDLLRYSISNKRDMMPVKDEINQIHNYLLIQKVRFEDKFEYEININKDLNEKLIPKLFIQPIVENSLTHGIENMSRHGRIEVLGYRTEENCVFEIKDNGSGINAEKLRAIFDDPENKNLNETHIGIANVNQRIKLIYGEECGIEISSIPNVETSVKIKLPQDI